jgi:hypothetical protein
LRWLATSGGVVSAPNNRHNYSPGGPRGDGGFKPNIMAPGSAVSTVPQWLKQPDLAEAGYTLPYGYAMFNGTSMASPQTAGAAALLLSASFDRGLAVTPRQLRESLYSSANFVKGLEPIAQGTGQVDVPGAWALVQKSPKPADYSVSAPVCTPISDFLAVPDRGQGVYNRCAADEGGQVVGKSKTYTVDVTRTSGGSKAVKHDIRLVGNDGTFSAPRSVTLRLDRKAQLAVKAKPTAKGDHSAILEIDDPATPVVDHRVLLTVVASEDLAAPSFTRSTSGSVERNLTKKVFVTVPPGAKALQVNLSGIATNSQVRWIAYNPYGVPVESTSSLECYTNFSNPATCKPTSRNYADPLPGVWELQVEARRTTPFLTNPFTLTAAAQGVTVDPATQTLASVKQGQATPVSWTVTNAFGAVTLTPQGGPLGSSVAGRKSIATGESQEFTVTVPAGATRLDASIGNPSDVGADLDLYLYNAAGTLVAQQADGDAEEAVSLANPPAGTYTVVVDGYEIPSGTTEYDYRDVFFSPALGSLTVPGTAVSLARGASTTVTGQLTANAAPATGRQLFGEMRAVSSEGAVLGTGAVVVSAVTP